MTVLTVLVLARAAIHLIAARRRRGMRRYHRTQAALLVGAVALAWLLRAGGADELGVAVLGVALVWLFAAPALLAVVVQRAGRRGRARTERVALRALDLLEPHGRYRERHALAAEVAAEVTGLARSGRPDLAARRLLSAGSALRAWPSGDRAELAVAAAAGRPDVLDRILAGPLADIPVDEAAAWRAAVAPRSPDPVLQDLLELRRRELHRVAETTPPAGWRPPWTRASAAVLVVVFAVEVLLDAAGDADRLVDLGAYVPGGSPLRALSAMVLHADLVHLAANLLVLLLFGRLVEWRIGRARTAAVALLSGVLAFLLPDWLGLMPADSVAVGASGALLGIVGAAFAGGVRRIRSGRAGGAERAEAVLLGAVVVLELALDLTLPSVFTAGHAAGVVVGAVVGWLLTPTPGPTPGAGQGPGRKP